MKERYFPEVVQAIVGGDRTIYVYFSDGKIVLYEAERVQDPLEPAM